MARRAGALLHMRRPPVPSRDGEPPRAFRDAARFSM
jgi:hypothetical protein